MLYDPASHEPLTDRPWDEDRVRAAIAAIAADTEGAFDDVELWRAHPLDDDDGPLTRTKSLYLGAAGVIWALHELGRVGVAELRRDWSPVAVGLLERYDAEPDFQESVPSLWMGESGILLVAHTLAPARWQEERLLVAVRANEQNPTCELMWGAPGTMIAARVMHERTGRAEWLDAWSASADALWEQWDDEVWTQDLYGRRGRNLGPAHGFVGNVLALAQGDLHAASRAELEQRTIETMATHAQRADDLCQWAPSLDPPRTVQPIRTQWCHGAPGVVASLASLAPRDERLTELLVGGGELAWHAGPLAKGANLCHGTAGNGYAFLKLLERTGDELWLRRARTFAMHAIEQVERAKQEHGRGRHSLWTGDLGTALYLQSCLAASTAFPTLDCF